MKILFVNVLIFAFSIFAPVLAQESGVESPQLQALIEQALKQNPAIHAAEMKWRSAQQRPAQESSLPEPLLSYTYFGESIETRLGPQEHVLSLSQVVPFPGKLGLKDRVWQYEAGREEQRFEATRRDMVFAVKTVYYDLQWIDQSLTILDDYLGMLDGFTDIAEQRYATGHGIQANALKAQVEVSSIIERKLSFEKLRQSNAAKLNRLLGWPDDSILQKLPPIQTPLTSEFAEDDILEGALNSRQEVLAINALVEKGRSMRALAGKSYLPDFRLQANYISIAPGVSPATNAGQDAWSVMLGINLPIWLGARKAAVHEADEMLNANKQRLEDTQNMVKAEIMDITAQIRLSKQTLSLYEQGLITQAESSLESAIASYGTGTLDFLSLLDAERMLLNLHLSYVKEQAAYVKGVAALERAAGGKLPQNQ